MKNETKLQCSRIALAAALFLFGSGIQAKAQNPTPQTPVEPSQTRPNQTNPITDFAPLNLSAEQVQKIRAINGELSDQRPAATLSLRQTQRALAEAIESTVPK